MFTGGAEFCLEIVFCWRRVSLWDMQRPRLDVRVSSQHFAQVLCASVVLLGLVWIESRSCFNGLMCNACTAARHPRDCHRRGRSVLCVHRKRSAGDLGWSRMSVGRFPRRGGLCGWQRCVFVCIYVYVCVCVCVWARERNRDREREIERAREREKVCVCVRERVI